MSFWNRGKKEQPDLDAVRAQARAEGRAAAIAEVEQALSHTMGVTTRTMAPNSPLGIVPGVPTWGPQHGAYAYNNPITYSTPQAPYRRPKSPVTLAVLRQLADTYDPLRSCINHLKREMRTTRFEVVARNGQPVGSRRLVQANALFARGGGVGGYGKLFRHFESAWSEDAMVIGAAAIFHERSRAGEWLSCETIDAETIRPIVDGYGWGPLDPSEPAYEQWVYGVMVTKMTRADLTYDGLHAVSHSPYFMSPVEWLVRVINAALYADQWNSAWLTDGNTPGDIYALPEQWSAEQVIQFADWWDGLLSGNTPERQKTRFLPGGTRNIGNPTRKDQDFQAFELWLLRRTCSIMGVQPASIGYVGEQYKVSQDASMEQTSRFGVGDMLTLRKSLLDDILERVGMGDLEVVDVSDVKEDEGSVATARSTKIGSGQLTINEARQIDGMEPVEGGDVPLVSGTLVALSQAITAPEPAQEPTDPQAAIRAEMKRWETKALKRLKLGKGAACFFESETLAPELHRYLANQLEQAATPDDIRAVFRGALETI